jgi:hypothetical protein
MSESKKPSAKARKSNLTVVAGGSAPDAGA